MTLRTTKNVAWIAVALVLATPGVVANGSNGYDEDLYQRVKADAKVEDSLSNDADVYQGGGDGHATAICQWTVAVNTILAALAEGDGLAVLTDDDFREIPLEALEHVDIVRENQTDMATASCTQSLGAVHISVQTGEGWGEPAPLGGALNGCCNGYRGNDVPELKQKVKADADVDDVLENDAYVNHDYGDGHAAAICQGIVAVNTLVIAGAFASGDATLSDEDQRVIDDPVELLQHRHPATEEDGDPNTLDTATASCSQTLTSLTIIVGRDAPTFPPQS